MKTDFQFDQFLRNVISEGGIQNMCNIDMFEMLKNLYRAKS